MKFSYHTKGWSIVFWKFWGMKSWDHNMPWLDTDLSSFNKQFLVTVLASKRIAYKSGAKMNERASSFCIVSLSETSKLYLFILLWCWMTTKELLVGSLNGWNGISVIHSQNLPFLLYLYILFSSAFKYVSDSRFYMKFLQKTVI